MNRTSNHENSHADFTELDRLVTQEINVFKQQGKKRTQERELQNHHSKCSENVISKDDWAKDISHNKESFRPQEPFFSDDLEGLEVEKDEVIISADNQQLEKSSGTEFFSEEELAFIERSTVWLESRENKDLIISQIWDQLTETTPDSFYSANPEDQSEIDNADTDLKDGQFDESDVMDSQNLSD